MAYKIFKYKLSNGEKKKGVQIDHSYSREQKSNNDKGENKNDK